MNSLHTAKGGLCRLFQVLCCAALLALGSAVSAAEVAFAGFAYSGAASSLNDRFPYSRRVEAEMKAQGQSLYAEIEKATAQLPPKNFTLTRRIDELKGRDQAISVALVVSSETVSVEQFGEAYKLFTLVRGQALFFDFKSMNVIRAYPLNFGYIDVLDRPPSDADKLAAVQILYRGSATKPGLVTRFAKALEEARLPSQVSRLLQVTQVVVKPEAAASIPAYLTKEVGGVETWAAELFGETLSSRTGVPVIPFAKGYAVNGVMAMTVSDGTVFNLKLPKPDYEISVEVSNLRKIEYGKSAAGTSWIYGSYATVKIEEPLSGKVFFNSALKNGEVKNVPVTQRTVDDFPAYFESLRGMFAKLTDAMDGKGTVWLKSAAASPDAEKQISETNKLLSACK